MPNKLVLYFFKAALPRLSWPGTCRRTRAYIPDKLQLERCLSAD